MDNDPLSSISNVEKGLGGINKQLDTAVGKLKQLMGLAGQTLTGVKQVLGGSLGQGTTLALGTSNAQFSNGTGGAGGANVLPWAYSKQGAATIGGMQLALGVAGAGYAALPGMATVFPRVMGTFQATQMMPGMTAARLQSMSFNAIKGGITGPGEDIAAMNALVNGYGMIGSANFTQSMQEVKGAALGYGMANATAAEAIGSMHTGAMSGNLYQYGISTLDVKTGKVRPMSDIAKQIYQRVMGNRTLTQAQLEFSMREGTLNKTINDLVPDQASQAILRPMIAKISQGQNPNLLTETGAGNPAVTSNIYNMNTTAADLANATAPGVIAGYATAAKGISSLNEALKGTPEALLKLKGAAEAVSGSNYGGAVSSLVSGVIGGLGTIGQAAAVTSILGNVAARSVDQAGGSVLVNAAKQGAVGTVESAAAKAGLGVAGRVLPIAGGALAGATGQGFLSTVGTAAATGAAFGAIGGEGIGAIPGALIGGGLAAVGWLGSKAIKSMTSKPAIVQGNKSQQEWAAGLLSRLGAPTTDQNLQAMTTWMAFEGGHWKNNANYNPLNTTMGESGAKSINSAGVKSYTSWDQGYQATIDTLKGGQYSNILSALQSGTDSSAVLSAVNASPWGTKIPGYAASATGTSAGGTQTVTINLNIAQASDAEAVAFAKKVKDILLKDKTLNAIGSK